MSLKEDSIIAKQKGILVKVCTKSGRGKKWETISFFDTIEDAFVFANSIKAYEVGILISFSPNSGSSIYWTTSHPDIFNDSIVSMAQTQSPNDINQQLCLHLYAEVEDELDAKALVVRLTEKLTCCAPVVALGFSQYWKIPEYYGFEFDFGIQSNPDAVFDCIVALSPGDWLFSGAEPERTAIWNAIEGSTFLSEEVRWAALYL